MFCSIDISIKPDCDQRDKRIAELDNVCYALLVAYGLDVANGISLFPSERTDDSITILVAARYPSDFGDTAVDTRDSIEVFLDAMFTDDSDLQFDMYATVTCTPLSGDDFFAEALAVVVTARAKDKYLAVCEIQKIDTDDSDIRELSEEAQTNVDFLRNFPAQDPDDIDNEEDEDDMLDRISDSSSESKRSVSKENAASRALSDIHSLIGADELKSYADELEAMRPILSQWRSSPQYPTQHLLFSIDPGNGCTTMLEKLHDYMEEAELHPCGAFGFTELTYSYSESLHVNMDGALSDIKNEIDYALPGLIAIHIEDWIKMPESPLFTGLLEHCFKKRHEAVFIFILPFLDDGVLGRMQARICDIINTRLIKFHPYSDEQLIDIAKAHLDEFGIGWDASADVHFRHALAGERSDQRFYGIKTAMKLATEITLMKARNVALSRNECPPDVLMGEDFAGSSDEVFESEISGFDQLDALVGLENVKQRIRELVVSLRAQKQMFEQGLESSAPCYHMMFTGNPGTGKTVVARILGRIFRENGLLPIGDLIEITRFDMVGEFIGQTGPKTVALCHSAHGSVMFIDEAYLLAGTSDSQDRDFGKEAIGALIAEMENNRDKFVVVMAGYKKDMDNLLKVNSGLRDRMPHRLHFENYNREELFEIFKRQLAGRYLCDDAFLAAAETYFLDLPDEVLNAPGFGNGRFVRNIVERVRIKALLRLVGEPLPENGKLTLLAIDLESAISDRDILGLSEKKPEKEQRIGFY
ncbi:AAA family ATPase [Oscillospiraceae bacterium OttesenSCG-928-G22]|nr:AAA family ATPase [Oscillospiraceae bacterium OttesenSCG-928-G22]